MILTLNKSLRKQRNRACIITPVAIGLLLYRNTFIVVSWISSNIGRRSIEVIGL